MSGRSRAGVTALFLLGFLLLQAAWALAVAPYRGLDEFDHAFRASGVALGEWRADRVDPEGGYLAPVTAREDLVEAARATCEWLPYTEPLDCVGVPAGQPGTVVVRSGASPYHPVFYWLTGAPSAQVDAGHALYVMRGVSALTCVCLVGIAVWVVTGWREQRWHLVALAAGLTPTFVYSTSVAAPNGVEMAAGLAVWACLLGLLRTDLPPARARLLLLATVAATCLVTPRALGPIWLLLIVAGWWWLARGQVLSLVRGNARSVLVATGVVGAAALGSVWWTLSAGTLASKPYPAQGSPVLVALSQVPVWIHQWLAAFPSRDEFPPPWIVLAVLASLTLLLVSLLRFASGGVRFVVLGLALATVLLPFILTVLSYAQSGAQWQGRYTLPVASGLLLVASWGADHSLIPKPELVQGAAGVALVVAAVASPLWVVGLDDDRPPMSLDPNWLPHSAVLLVSLAMLGAACAVTAVALARARQDRVAVTDVSAAAPIGENS